jgi:hypothetical protein
VNAQPYDLLYVNAQPFDLSYVNVFTAGMGCRLRDVTTWLPFAIFPVENQEVISRFCVIIFFSMHVNNIYFNIFVL